MKFFVINKNPKSLIALRFWLKKEHKYNSYTMCQEDRNGNPIIPIRWDRRPDSDWGKPDPVSGIIVVKDRDKLDEVYDIVSKNIHK